MNGQGIERKDFLDQAAPWLLIVVGALIYANSFAVPFVFDDLGSIVENRDIRQLWPPRWAAVTDQVQAPTNSRPLVALTLAFNYALGGLDVRGYRAVNIVLHLLCGLAFLGVLRRTLAHGNFQVLYGRDSAGLALACALLWTVHPLQSQCVNYTIQRSETLMGLCYLLTLYCVIRASGVSGVSKTRNWHVVAVIVCALGMASKETMVTAPLLVLLYDRAFLTTAWADVWHRRRNLYAGLAATWILLGLLMWRNAQCASIGFATEIGAYDYALNQCVVLLDYLRLAFWPNPLAFDYGFPRVLSLPEVALEAMGVVGLVGATGWALYRHPALGFLCVWFFAILGPTSSFVPIVNEVGADRRFYLSLAALIVLVVLGGYVLLDRLGWVSKRRCGGILVLVAAVALSYATIERNRDYRSHLALWQSVVEAVPDNARGHVYTGLALRGRGESEAALVHFHRAVELRPNFAEAHNNLGLALAEEGQIEAALAHFRQALGIYTDFVEARENLATALLASGQIDAAIVQLQEVLRRDPDRAAAHNNLGSALGSLGRVEEALGHFQRAVELDPDLASARENLLRAQTMWRAQQ